MRGHYDEGTHFLSELVRPVLPPDELVSLTPQGLIRPQLS